MTIKPHIKFSITLIIMMTLLATTGCSNQNDQASLEQIDQSKLVLVDDSAKYIDWNDARLVKALDDWQATPSLYEPVGIMLSDRGEADGLTLEQTINKLHDEYEPRGVDSCYMAVMIEALSSEMKMFNQKTFELNLPINPDGEKVALNAVNIKPQAGYDYADLASAIDDYINDKIDQQAMADFVDKLDMKLVIADEAYDKLYACDVMIREIGENKDATVVKLIVNSGVDGAYFEILR